MALALLSYVSSEEIFQLGRLKREPIIPLSLRQNMRHHADDQETHNADIDENMAGESLPGNMADREMMTLIPWKDIWTSLKIASHRGDGEMVAVFYDTLFKEAVFDDNGAWAWDLTKRN